MNDLRPSYLNAEWTVEDARCYVSPDLDKDQLEQIVLFDDEIANGSIEAAVTALDGLPDEYPAGRIEATILFRYKQHATCYCAGLGAYGNKYFIARVSHLHEKRQKLELLAAVGEGSSLRFRRERKESYRLRVEFMGRQITLFENEVPLLSVEDEAYQTGRWGLRTFKTRARFASLSARAERPRCFVVMPFSPDLNRAFHAIKKTVEAAKLRCIRADQIRKSRPIIDDIRAEIAQANLVVIDFTGKNSNVYYEAGIADAWKKPWIILAQSLDDLTFDVKQIRAIVYSNTPRGRKRLEHSLAQAIEETMGLSPEAGKTVERRPVRSRPGDRRATRAGGHQAKGGRPELRRA